MFLKSGISLAIGQDQRSEGRRASLSLQFAGATALDPRITFTRASSATFTGSDGLLQTAAVDAPRLTYNPTTLAAEGLLVEEQRTNLLTYSQDFGNAVWTKNAATITANTATAPDGTLTAAKITATSTNSYIQQVFTSTAGVSYTGSFYIKAGNTNTVQLFGVNQGVVAYSAQYNLLTVTATPVAGSPTCSISAASDGWFRCTITKLHSAGNANDILQFIPGVADATVAGNFVYIWGADLEAGAFATSYIPTTTAQVTRAADVAVMTGTNFSSWYNQSEGTLCAEVSVSTLSGFAWPISASAGTSANTFGVYKSSIYTAGFIASSGASQLEIVASPVVVNTPFKVAISAQAGSGNFSFNGSIADTDTSITMPTVDRLSIGTGQSGDTDYLNGNIKSITYYPRRLANTELQALTLS